MLHSLSKWDITQKQKQQAAFLIQLGLVLWLTGAVLVFTAYGVKSQTEPLTFWFLYGSPSVFLLNFLPVAAFYTFFSCVTARPLVAYCILSFLNLLVSLVNYYKIALRGQALLWSDLTLVREAVTMLEEYTLKANGEVWFLVGMHGLGLLILCWVMPFSFRLEELGLTKPLRWKGAGLSGLLCLVIAFVLLPSNWLYQATEEYEDINRLSQPQVYLTRGIWYPFLHSSGKDAGQEVEDYHWNPQEEEKKPLGEISVVSVMLEGFCDYTEFSALAQEEGVLEVYEPWHRWENMGVNGTLIHTNFGGGTAYTERSVLTGYPHADDPFSQVTDSYVWDFREAGYETFGGHPGYEEFYNRLQVNPNLGFQKYDYYENRYSDFMNYKAVYWSSDRIFMDLIIEDLEQRAYPRNPFFAFYVTIQNHGPYEVETNLTNSFASAESGLGLESRGILQSYLTGIQDTLGHLERLQEYIWSRQDPIILVMFGDHKPWGGVNHVLFQEAGADFDTSSAQGMEDYYGTPYVILANPAAQASLEGQYPGYGGVISNHFLLNKVFQLVGWEESDRMALASEVMAEVPVVFRSWEYAYWYKGALTLSLPKELQELVNYYVAMSYIQRYEPYLPSR